MSTFLSSRGFALLKSAYTEEELQNLRDELTVSPKVQMMIGNAEIPKYKCYVESNKKLYIPKSYGLEKFGIPKVNKLDQGVDISIEFTQTLRPNQMVPVQMLIDACNDETQMGGLLELSCGQGKTIISLYVISQLKKKSMIIVHKNFLLEQWKERIEEFIPNARIGLIKAKIIDVEDKDIILASLQSLSMKEYDPNIFKGIGTVVVDEIHRTSSEVFSRAYFKHVPRYSIGLSATMVRQDGLSKVFKWHCGQVVFKNIKRNDHVTVNCKKYSNDDTKYCREVALFNGTPMVPTMITNIGNFEPRNNFIIDIIKDILEKEPDRCILLLSDRREHLKILKKKIEKQNLARCGLMIGGVKQVDLDYNAEHCQILLGTYALTDTGLDIYKLDTLILATPKNNVIQSVGRILRKKVVDRTYTPLVIDIIDQFSVFPNQFKKRMKYYRSNNFDIISNIDTTDKIQQENVKLKSFAFI